MSEHDGKATFSLAEVLQGANESYCDGYLACLWAIEARLRKGTPWCMIYGAMMAFIRGPLGHWAESANGDVNAIPPCPTWGHS